MGGDPESRCRASAVGGQAAAARPSRSAARVLDGALLQHRVEGADAARVARRAVVIGRDSVQRLDVGRATEPARTRDPRS
jgi:hypothetical protein